MNELLTKQISCEFCLQNRTIRLHSIFSVVQKIKSGDPMPSVFCFLNRAMWLNAMCIFCLQNRTMWPHAIFLLFQNQTMWPHVMCILFSKQSLVTQCHVKMEELVLTTPVVDTLVNVNRNILATTVNTVCNNN